MATDYRPVSRKAESYKPAISRFLRDLIALPSESCQEKEVIRRIKTGDGDGGLRSGRGRSHGERLGYMALDAPDRHGRPQLTAWVWRPANWKFDPFKGYEDDEVIGGRGASDQTGGMASLVYAGKIIKDLQS